MIGVLPTHEALQRARSESLDLVEVDGKATPPVCKILDFGKYKYDKKKQESERRANQTVVELKEIKLRPKTDDHDLDFKIRAARRFLEERNKVKFTVRFRGREITHPEKAREQLDFIISKLQDIGVVEGRAQMEAKTMFLIVAPKKP
jgi:translation initiation factor IF-3